MKRRDLDKQIKQIAKKSGATISFDNGANHDKWYINGTLITVPRHNEVSEMLAKSILEQAKEATK